jgi:hypothetical protein
MDKTGKILLAAIALGVWTPEAWKPHIIACLLGLLLWVYWKEIKDFLWKKR